MNNSWKAALAAVLAGLTALVTDLQGADANLTFRDWVIIVVAAVVAGGGTWLVPPGPGITTPRAARRTPGAQGYGALELAIGVVVLIILVVLLARLL